MYSYEYIRRVGKVPVREAHPFAKNPKVQRLKYLYTVRVYTEVLKYRVSFDIFDLYENTVQVV